MALDTLSLPVLEPLTPGRLLDVTVLALSCLYAGMLLMTLIFIPIMYLGEQGCFLASIYILISQLYHSEHCLFLIRMN